MRNIYLGLFILLFSQSCVINPEPIDVEIEDGPQEIVLNMVNFQPSIIAVSLTKSFSALLIDTDSIGDESIELLENLIVDPAEVIVSYDGRDVELTRLIPGFYGSVGVELIPNMDYRLTAIDLTIDKMMKAETTVLPQVTIEDILFEEIMSVDSLFIGNKLTYVINDPPDEDNYYLLSQSQFSEAETEITGIGDIFNSDSDFQLLRDQELFGQTGQQLSYEFNTSYNKGDTINVSLSNITEEYYDYLVAYRRLGNILTGLLSEPIRSLPSNVEGGLGYFNLELPDSRTVVLE